jgi:hypothetical protein
MFKAINWKPFLFVARGFVVNYKALLIKELFLYAPRLQLMKCVFYVSPQNQ